MTDSFCVGQVQKVGVHLLEMKDFSVFGLEKVQNMSVHLLDLMHLE